MKKKVYKLKDGYLDSAYVFYNRKKLNELLVDTETRKIEFYEFADLNDGWELQSANIYKQGKHIFGNVSLSKISEISLAQESAIIIKEPYRPSTEINSFCCTSDSPWTASDSNVGGCYIVDVDGRVLVNSVRRNHLSAKFDLNYCTL